MQLSRKLETSLLYAAAVLFLTNLVCKAFGLAWLKHMQQLPAGDGPTDHLWYVERKPVQIEFDQTLHYGLDNAAEWAALSPNDGVIYLGKDHEPYTVSMLHQLKCMDVIRAQLVEHDPERNDLARHCMNYVRQTTLCRGDDNLEPYQYPSRIEGLDKHNIRKCFDWNAVYDAVEENVREHNAWLASRDSAARA